MRNSAYPRDAALGPLCLKVGSGVTPRGGASVYVDSGTALIRSQNIYNADFAHDRLAFIDDQTAEKMKGVSIGFSDILLNITGDSVARCCQVPDDVLPARVNQHVSIIRPDQDKLHPRYLMYFLVSPFMQAIMLSLAGSGGTRKALTKTMIERFRIPLPDLPKQRKIASILSAYDELIENNRRRIVLLERATRELYREWFVRLRFPGHEHMKIVDGVPEGWERKTLGDIVKIAKGQNITRNSSRDGSVPVVAGGLSPAYYHDTANVVAPVITVSASGANAGYVNIYHEDIWASDCSYISGTSTEYLYYLYLLLRSRQMEIFGFQKGVAQPHVYPKDLQRLLLLAPKEGIVKRFDDFVSHNFRQTGGLHRQNKQLGRARDILLPRLMSGEVAV